MKYQKAEHLIIEKVGLAENDDVMIQNEETGEVIVVNWSAGVILDKLTAPASMEEVVDAISAEFNCDSADIADDIRRLLNQLQEKHILTVVPFNREPEASSRETTCL